MCALALGATAGFVFAQEQGPLNTNPGTVAKKKSADGKGDDTDLPKIPSAYTKKDGVDLANAPKYKTETAIVTLDAAVIVTVAVSDFVLSACEIALTVTVAGTGTAVGAV